jgi:hypothetical protein
MKSATIKTCLCGCGSEVFPDGRGRPRNWVKGHAMIGKKQSAETIKKAVASRKITNPNYGNSKQPRICKTCGTVFVQKHRHNPLYCSGKCYPQAEAFRQKKWETKRLEAYNRLPQTKPLSETRHNVKRWHLRSPANIEYHPLNLNRFVLMNAHLFDPNDVVSRYKSGKSSICRAVASLKHLRPSDKKKKQTNTWKGWTWISIYERRFNDGRDLLER